MCEVLEVPGFGRVIVCGGRRHRAKPCVHCGDNATQLCDHRNSDGRTCDAPICSRCSTKDGTKDYCRAHARLHPRSAALPFEAPAP